MSRDQFFLICPLGALPLDFLKHEWRTPRARLKRGVEMSMKGDQNNQKHGGPHGSSHVYSSVLKKVAKNDNQVAASVLKPTVLFSDQNGTGVLLAQDGVDNDHHRQIELETLIENHSDELGPSFVDGGNTEWITTTVDELGNIIFSTPGDDDPLGLSTNGTHDSKSKISDAIFDVVENSLASVDPATAFAESNPHLRIKMESAIGAKSSPCSPVHSSEANSSGAGRQRSFSDSEEKLTAEDRACLEEIKRGSQLTLEDQELIEDSKQRLQLELQDFDTTTDKSSSLMTAQELQTLQDRGLDFDANDDPPSSDNPMQSDIAKPSSPSQIAQITEAPSLATICITTNKKQNSTQIVIDTKTGQQIYQLNTSDLNRGTGSNVTLIGDDGTVQNVFLESIGE